MKAQRYKNQTLTRSKVKNNILRIWNESTEKERFDWYKGANDFAFMVSYHLPDKNGHIKACGILAALSPMVKWTKNMELALLVIKGVQPEDLPCLKANARKAKAIMDSDGKQDTILKILKGQKISAFFLNILYPKKAIHLTIDRHALSIAVGKSLNNSDMQITAGQYEFFSECYRWTAAKLHISPLLLQSATWLAWRRLKKAHGQREIKF